MAMNELADEVTRIFTYLHDAIRKELEEIRRFAAVHPSALGTGDFLSALENYRFLVALCHQYCLVEDAVMGSLESLDNVILPKGLDNDHANKLMKDMSQALWELKDLHTCLAEDGSNDFMVANYMNQAAKLQWFCRSAKAVLEDHISIGEPVLCTAFRNHVTAEAQEVLLATVLGLTYDEVMKDMLLWVKSSLPQYEQQNVLSAWEHVTRNTQFNVWLSKFWEDITSETFTHEFHQLDCYRQWLVEFWEDTTSETFTHEFHQLDCYRQWLVEFQNLPLVTVEASERDYWLHNPRHVFFCPFCDRLCHGRGLGVDLRHCMRCNSCVSMQQEQHACFEGRFEGDCPLCQENLLGTEDLIRLPCGHCMHDECFLSSIEALRTCPVCRRPINIKIMYI